MILLVTSVTENLSPLENERGIPSCFIQRQKTTEYFRFGLIASWTFTVLYLGTKAC